MTDHSEGINETTIKSLPLHYRGKVRDIYTIDAQHWLIITTDRVSAFDVILPSVIPGKGKLLNELALFWFDKVKPLVGNHLTDRSLTELLPDAEERRQAEGRSMIVKRLDPVPFEAVVRGYLSGSGWKDYQASGAISGVSLPAGLQQSAKLEPCIFTPATKAALGDHDENVSFADMQAAIGRELAEQIRAVSLDIFTMASAHAEARGLILADTKFEFGLDEHGTLTLMDEILTPDSSRFWEAEGWQVGVTPPSFDKQFLRDWLETLDWNKEAPGPTLPESVAEGTLQRYREAVRRLTD